MKISILGTGAVGQALASGLAGSGHEVTMGTRNVKEKEVSSGKDVYGNPSSFRDWHQKNSSVMLLTFADSAASGELIVNATRGDVSLEALKMAGKKNLDNKILIDVSNPLDFSRGMPPILLPEYCNTNSLGEEIQKAFPGSRVVKTFNTMWNGLMLNPGIIAGGDHVNFISGNDEGAKKEVKNLLKESGWKESNLIDLGDITAARAQESMLLIWLRIMGALQTGAFNFRIVR